MAEQRFGCTACGKCCYGRLPLTLADAVVNAGRFPLAMVWTPVRQGNRAFELTAQLGTTIRLRNRKLIAVQIAPTAYIPPGFPCPALSPDDLCAIHADKPLRCRTMPFFPYREEQDQVDMLVPRQGWRCDTTAAAPLVYRDRKIIDPANFERERSALMADAPKLRAYAETLLKQSTCLAETLTKVAVNSAAGHVIVNFSSFLRITKQYDMLDFAKAQHKVLLDFERKTAGHQGLTEYHKYYQEWAAELEWFANRSRS